MPNITIEGPAIKDLDKKLKQVETEVRDGPVRGFKWSHQGICRGSSLTLVGFGTFRTKYRKTRMGFNPRTGERIKIRGKNVVSFKPGKSLQ